MVKCDMLKPGIVSYLGNTKFDDPVSYIEEVKNFLENAGEFQFPFVNQSKPFRRLVSHLAHSPYPFLVLVGDVGIGKTMMVDHALAVIHKKVSIEEIAKSAPELKPDFERLMEKAGQFEHRDYLILPNTRTPRKIEALSYRNNEIERDALVADEFCRDIADVLMHYPEDYRQKIRFRFKEEEYMQYIKSMINEFYIGLYEEVSKLVTKNKDVAVVTVTPKEKKPKTKQYPFTTKWKFLNPGVKIGKYKTNAGYRVSSRGVKIEGIEKGLASTLIYAKARKPLDTLMETLVRVDIKDKSQEDIVGMILEEFGKYNQEVLLPYQQQYEEEKFLQSSLVSELRQRPKYRHMPKISETTLEDLEAKIDSVRDRFSKDDCSPRLSDWMNSIVSYFKEERTQIERTIIEMLKELTEKEKAESKEEAGKRKTKEEGGAEEKEAQYKGEFRLRHGDYRMPVDRIFQINVFKDPAASGAVNSMVIRDFSSESLFATFKQHDIETPPHMTITSLGTYFQGGILVFPDYFGRFVQTLRGVVEGSGATKYVTTGSMRERFLESLQKGIMTISNAGISFTFEAPRVILGCDNSDPFRYTEGLMQRYDYALSDRIEKIGVQSCAENNAEARRGTLRVMFGRVKEFNETELKDRKIELSPEVADFLLREAIAGESLDFLLYRRFTKRIDEVLRFAARMGESKVTLDTLKTLNLENSDDIRFAFNDIDYKNSDGYTTLPTKQVGFVNGIALILYPTALDYVFGSMRHPLSSYIAKSRDPLTRGQERFVLIEKAEEMTDVTANKGYELAKDYVRNWIHNLRMGGLAGKEGWQLKTESYGEKCGFEGDSAALAIAISMISALAGDEVYKNRFFTGTLQPQNDTIGKVGGLLYKALTPTRLHTLFERDEKKEEMYFIFPAGNRKEFKEDAMIDPFGIETKIVSIPVQNIQQAYYLATCGNYLTETDLKDIETRSTKLFEKTKERVRERFKEVDKPVDK